MKVEQKDIKEVSTVIDFFNRTEGASKVFAEQNEQNAYMLVFVEEVTVNGRKQLITHQAFAGNKKNLCNALVQGAEDNKICEVVLMGAAGKFAKSKIKEIYNKVKEGKK